MLATQTDRDFMWRALELAQKGLYTTTPNPRVGCIIVREGKIVGEGWHEKAGEDGHRWHPLACAILTAGRTVARDNPQLTVRGVSTPRQPLRVILDSKGEIPANAKVLADENALLVYGKERPWSFAAPVEAIS